MISLNDYMVDGAHPIAQAVLGCIRSIYVEDCEVSRWENCREQGYVIRFNRNKNIAFFEHRNSDRIHAVMFEYSGMNSSTIRDIPKDHPYYASKYATDFSVAYDEPYQMAEWICEQIEDSKNDKQN